ncbi:hypothetical protein MTO96_051554 [Rhipicephalus appendiculatus]
MQPSNRPLAENVFQGSVIMEEAPLVSAITQPSEPGSLIISTEPPESKPELRETMLAVITCVCLVAMISVVVALIVSSSHLVKAIICTTMAEFTPQKITAPGYSSSGWPARRRNTEFGISFSFDVVTPDNLDESIAFLNLLRGLRIRHYGLLTVLTFQSDYSSTISSMRGIIAKLKELQGSDPKAKTVLAFGPNEYSADFMTTIQAEFTNAVNTFKADIVIAITSTGWLASEGDCRATPPNSINTDKLGHTVLESHWFAVSAKTIFSKPSIITGLSFELSALKYIMVENPTSLNDSVFRPVLVRTEDWDKKRSATTVISLEAPRTTSAIPYTRTASSPVRRKSLTWSEYNDSLAIKFLNALNDLGELRKETAWLLYNVHNEGPTNGCPGTSFTVLKHFRAALKGAEEPAQP